VNTHRAIVVAAIGTTQTIAWASSYYMPAILGAPIASALHLPTSVSFGLFSGALLLSAVVGPSVGRLIDRHGGRVPLATSNLVIAAGLVTLAAAHGVVGLVIARTVLVASASAWASTTRPLPRRFLVDRHARWTVEKVDLQSATLFLGEGRVPYRKRKHQRTRCREHAQISFHLLPPVPQRRISNPRLHPCWPFCWALVQDCNYEKVTTFQTSALSA
jgi:hypothetical protein